MWKSAGGSNPVSSGQSFQMKCDGKRSYIHRKKYLNDCVNHIKGVLEFIRVSRGDAGSPEELCRQALVHAQSIEAVCWSPHSHLSAEGHQKIMAAKTHELCQTILPRAVPSFDFPQFFRLATAVQECARLPRPSLPMPIIAQRPPPVHEASPFDMPDLDFGPPPAQFFGENGLDFRLAEFDPGTANLDLTF
jgi:hypothetical protein